MAYTTLPNSGLRLNNPANGNTNWSVEVFDYNMTRLNNTLLKLNALLDVDVSGLAVGDVLVWNVGTSKWIPMTPEKAPL